MGKANNLKKFTKGASGNPSGKVRGTPNFATVANKLLAAMTTVEDGEKQVKMSKRNAMIFRLIEDAVSNPDANVRLRAVAAIFDRVEGRPVMKVEAEVNQEPKCVYVLPDGTRMEI
jgi:hypothetical protein